MADRDITAEKYQEEIIDQGVDFVNILSGSDSVSSGTVVVTDRNGTDVTSTLVTGSAAVNGTQVYYRLAAAGTAGQVYNVFVTATLNTGEKISQLIKLSVLDSS